MAGNIFFNSVLDFHHTSRPRFRREAHTPPSKRIFGAWVFTLYVKRLVALILANAGEVAKTASRANEEPPPPSC